MPAARASAAMRRTAPIAALENIGAAAKMNLGGKGEWDCARAVERDCLLVLLQDQCGFLVDGA